MTAATDTPCPICGCDDPTGATAHAIGVALVCGDLDRAIETGLLDCEPCAACTSDCRNAVICASRERRRALAARERYRARQARMQRRIDEREARRSPAMDTSSSTSIKSTLPPAAAAALARAKAKVTGST